MGEARGQYRLLPSRLSYLVRWGLNTRHRRTDERMGSYLQRKRRTWGLRRGASKSLGHQVPIPC